MQILQFGGLALVNQFSYITPSLNACFNRLPWLVAPDALVDWLADELNCAVVVGDWDAAASDCPVDVVLAAEDVIEDVLPSELSWVDEAPLDCCSDTGNVAIALLLKPGEGLDNVIELSEADAPKIISNYISSN